MSGRRGRWGGGGGNGDVGRLRRDLGIRLRVGAATGYGKDREHRTGYHVPLTECSGSHHALILDGPEWPQSVLRLKLSVVVTTLGTQVVPSVW
ncbi:hypothetical protein GCM10029992_13060 [Glycomyces albus]